VWQFSISVICALSVNASALAADLSPRPAGAAPAPSPWDFAFGGALASDYNVRGISVSARGPSLNAYFEPRYKVSPNLEFYTGISGTSIAIPNRATAQFVYYAGLRPTVGAVTFDLGLAYIDYPGGILFNGIGSPANCTNGSFFFGICNTNKAIASFWEGYAKAAWNVSDALSLGGNLYYSPSWVNSGAPGTYASVTAKVTLPSSMLPKDIGASVSSELGYYWFGTTDAFYGVPAFPAGVKLPDYTTWNIGLSVAYKVFTLDLRYYDTNLSKANCNVLTGDHTATFGGASAVTPINPSGLVSNWCSAAFIAKLSFDVTLAGLK
jgi:uncharacterized protein (TIGR02001 family)